MIGTGKILQEKELDFLGTTAMIDPPRNEVTEAIGECKTAGIRIVMITGDQPITGTKRQYWTGQQRQIRDGTEVATDSHKDSPSLGWIPEGKVVQYVGTVAMDDASRFYHSIVIHASSCDLPKSEVRAGRGLPLSDR